MTDLAEMPFINPGFVWAACALAVVPLLITLLNRRRHREVPWAAMRFLIAANRKSMRRSRIEQVLLLLLRTLLLILLALALARPWLLAGRQGGLLASGTHHILVLDDSYSMFAAEDAGARRDPAFEQQRRRALAVLQAVPSGDPITVLTQGAPAVVRNRHPIESRAVARRLIQKIAARQSHTDFAGALHQVAEIIDAAEDTQATTVHVFSDFGRSALRDPAAARRAASRVAESARLVLHDVYDGPTANRVNAFLGASDRLLAVNQPTQLTSRIVNYAAVRSPPGRLWMQIDGRQEREIELPAMEPQETRQVVVTVDFSSPGLHTVESRVLGSDDVLTLDDSRRAVITVREQMPLLVVDGKPDVSLLNGQAGYLATALAPGFQAGRSTFLAPTIVSDDELQTHLLTPDGLVILCNVRRLEPAQWERLAEVVRGGAGLLIFLGDLVDIDHYNEWGRGLLPAGLDGPALVGVGEDDWVHFDARQLGGALAAVFEGRARSGLFRAQVRQYIRLIATLEHTQPLLWYDNGDLAAAARQVEQGRCVVVGTSANMDWSNLPAKGDFVALALSLVHDIAPAGEADHNTVVGQPCPERLWATAGGDIKIVTPDGATRALVVTADPEGRQVAEPLEQAGWYTVQSALGDAPLAVNLDPLEGDLTPLSQDDLRQALACEFEYVAAAAERGPSGTRSELTRWMVYAVVGLLLAETFLAMKFGHQRR